ncbi:hypothetical protein MFIFM68171_03122 [Madurella fahalii]|uniref:Centromere protein Q n=1 Tax=Madurella fahalii TaxID=1157608 RepID=A0ABQ0G584_9PEZI
MSKAAPMAPGRPIQKRRRGRSPSASKAAESVSGSSKDASAQEPTGKKSSEADSAPKKRGQPKRNGVGLQEEAPPAHNNHAGKPSALATRKRGRPPKARDTQADEEETTEARPRKRMREDKGGAAENWEEDGEGGSRSKRNKPSANTFHQDTQAEEEVAIETTAHRNRRGRPPADDNQREAPMKEARSKAQADSAKAKAASKFARPELAEAEGQALENSTRRSRRERRSADEKPWWAASEAAPADASAEKERPGPSKKPKRGRSSLAEVSISKAQNQAGASQSSNQGTKTGRGRSSLSPNNDSPSEKDTQPQTVPKSKSNPKPRRHSSAAETAQRGERETEQTQEPTPEPQIKYRHLSSRTRQIPRATITSKWTPLSPEAIAAVSALVTDASRPVLLRLSDRSDARHDQAQTILRTFSARLHSKLAKGMPFPPPTAGPSSAKSKKRAGEGGHETELDFEKTVDAIGRLERALDPLLHSVALLKGEREREERELEREYKLLKRLEGNAKAERREWRERGKRGHLLAGGVGGGVGADGEEEKGGDERGLEFVKKGKVEGGVGGVFKDLQEEELLALSQQIGSHMESMRSNLGQIEGVLPAIAKSRAALQAALCQHLEPEQYDQVLLG